MVGVTVHATFLIVLLSATVTCMNLPEKFVDQVMQDVIAEIIEDETQNLGRRELMDHVYQDWQYLKACSKRSCGAISIANKSDDMLSCMKTVAEMDTPLNYTERIYLDMAFKYVLNARGSASKRAKTNEEKRNILNGVVELCESSTRLLADHLIAVAKNDNNTEAVVQYSKQLGYVYSVKGYYFKRTLLNNAAMQAEAYGKAKQVYDDAFELAKKKLKPWNMIRLYLSMKRADFYLYFLGKKDEALSMIRSDLDGSKDEYDNIKMQIDKLQDFVKVYKAMVYRKKKWE